MFLVYFSSLPWPSAADKCNRDRSYSSQRTAELVLPIVSSLSYPDAFLCVSFTTLGIASNVSPRGTSLTPSELSAMPERKRIFELNIENFTVCSR